MPLLKMNRLNCSTQKVEIHNVVRCLGNN